MVGSVAVEVLSRLGKVLPVDPSSLSDLQLIGLIETLAQARRHLDALDLAAAGEMARRSVAGAPESLAQRLGYATPAHAIEAITKSSGGEARKLVADAQQLTQLPAVEAAVLAGQIGRESAAAIAGELKKATERIPGGEGAPGEGPGGKPGDAAVAAERAAQLAAAQQQLVELAATHPADQVRVKAHELAAELTPQAVAGQASRAMSQRFLWLSPTRDGVATIKGVLPAGHAAVIRGVLDAYVNPRGKKTVAFTDAGADSDAPCEPRDTRTAGQKRADVLRDVFAAQARAAEAPDMGGDHPTVWLTATVAELESGEGLAFYGGTEGAVPVAEAEQAACASGVQVVICGEGGNVLRLGRQVRGFSRRQRRAIAARDGGTCLIPGCTVPAQWCEVHHVIAYRDGGATDVDNGVNLCWFHHHEIDSGPWQIRMRSGLPEVRYAFGSDIREWAPAGTGAAARMRAVRRRPG